MSEIEEDDEQSDGLCNRGCGNPAASDGLCWGDNCVPLRADARTAAPATPPSDETPTDEIDERIRALHAGADALYRPADPPSELVIDESFAATLRRMAGEIATGRAPLVDTGGPTAPACDCYKYEHQLCDICQGVTGDEVDAPRSPEGTGTPPRPKVALIADGDVCCDANSPDGYLCEYLAGHAGDHGACLDSSDERGPVPELHWPTPREIRTVAGEDETPALSFQCEPMTELDHLAADALRQHRRGETIPLCELAGELPGVGAAIDAKVEKIRVKLDRTGDAGSPFEDPYAGLGPTAPSDADLRQILSVGTERGIANCRERRLALAVLSERAFRSLLDSCVTEWRSDVVTLLARHDQLSAESSALRLRAEAAERQLATFTQKDIDALNLYVAVGVAACAASGGLSHGILNGGWAQEQADSLIARIASTLSSQRTL